MLSVITLAMIDLHQLLQNYDDLQGLHGEAVSIVRV